MTTGHQNAEAELVSMILRAAWLAGAQQARSDPAGGDGAEISNMPVTGEKTGVQE